MALKRPSGKAAPAMKGSSKAVMKPSMKAKKPSTIARGSRMYAAVFSGRKEKTYTGLTKSDLQRNSYNRIVSKRRSALAKKRYQGSQFQRWINALAVARNELNLTGFVLVNSSTVQGRALFMKARAIYRDAA
mmetsp:Transcript_22613/g.59690  ORF Transcript_22613/g.59690 Transcript_22613/m.59690 type:complete len:132 (-) Transcript_22613:169-564(-)